MTNFEGRTIKRGKCNAFNQHYKSTFSEKVFNIVSKELDVYVNICENLEKYFEFSNKCEKVYAKEFDSKFKNFRDVNQKEKEKHITKKFNMLPIHKQLSKLDLNIAQMDFDATPLYTSAM